jgi:hypothetical protein
VQTQENLVWVEAKPKAWYHQIDLFFINEGFLGAKWINSLYVRQKGQYSLVAILYVDDLIILAKNVNQLKWLKLSSRRNLR